MEPGNPYTNFVGVFPPVYCIFFKVNHEVIKIYNLELQMVLCCRFCQLSGQISIQFAFSEI